MSLRFFIGIYLCVVMAASGLAYSKHLQRRYFIELQALQLNHNKLQTEWEQLLLEESAWSNEMRIEKIATQKLGMQTLEYSDLVMLELD
jgi:cell division protein FtsL